MKIKLLQILIFATLTSCAATTGYVITTFDERGEIDKVFRVQKYEIESGKIKFEGGEVDAGGSVKIEEYKK